MSESKAKTPTSTAILLIARDGSPSLTRRSRSESMRGLVYGVAMGCATICGDPSIVRASPQVPSLAMPFGDVRIPVLDTGADDAAATHLRLSNMAMRNGNDAEAVEEAKKADVAAKRLFERHPDHPDTDVNIRLKAAENLAMTAAHSDDDAVAVTAADDVLGLTQGVPAMSWLKGSILYAAGNIEGAEASISKVPRPGASGDPSTDDKWFAIYLTKSDRAMPSGAWNLDAAIRMAHGDGDDALTLMRGEGDPMGAPQILERAEGLVMRGIAHFTKSGKPDLVAMMEDLRAAKTLAPRVSQILTWYAYGAYVASGGREYVGAHGMQHAPWPVPLITFLSGESEEADVESEMIRIQKEHPATTDYEKRIEVRRFCEAALFVTTRRMLRGDGGALPGFSRIAGECPRSFRPQWVAAAIARRVQEASKP